MLTLLTIAPVRAADQAAPAAGRGFCATPVERIKVAKDSACKSADGKRWIITAWEPFDRGWANPRSPCLHSDPRFPGCEPGQTQRVHGGLSFYEDTQIEAELKRLDRLRKGAD